MFCRSSWRTSETLFIPTNIKKLQSSVKKIQIFPDAEFFYLHSWVQLHLLELVDKDANALKDIPNRAEKDGGCIRAPISSVWIGKDKSTYMLYYKKQDDTGSVNR